MEWAGPHCDAMAAKTKNELKKNVTFTQENPQVSLYVAHSDTKGAYVKLSVQQILISA